MNTKFLFFSKCKLIDLQKSPPRGVCLILFLVLLNVFGVFAGTEKPTVQINNSFQTETNVEIGLAIQQQVSIRGKVTDEWGDALPGVSIIIVGTTRGVNTDSDGNYSIDTNPTDKLKFSYIGTESQIIDVGNRRIIDVVMVESIAAIDEVVVVGYGTKRKADLTGSISVVDTKHLKAVKATSAAQALQGMASGVNVILSSVPGKAPRINIRGFTSFGSNDPLVIVDGIEQTLNNISASDIETIQVLKDAGSSSIYGVRGANGVILITTKKGDSRQGKPVVSYNGNVGVTFPLQGNVWNIMNTPDYLKMYNVAYPGNPYFSDGRMPDYMYGGAAAGYAFKGDPAVDPSHYVLESPNIGNNYVIQEFNKEGTDWFHELFKRSLSTDHNLQVSGGNDHAKYLFSLGYLDYSGTLIKTIDKRYTVRINTEYKLGKHIKVGENLNFIHRYGYVFSENTQFGGITETIKLRPYVPTHDIMGNFGGAFGMPSGGDGRNPVAEITRAYDMDLNSPLNYTLLGNVFTDVNFLKNFTFRTSLGYNIGYSFTNTFNQPQIEATQGNGNPHSLSVSSGLRSYMTFTNTLNYNNEFGKHHVDVLVGSEAIKNIYRSVSGSRTNYFTTNKYYLVLGTGALNISNSSSIEDDRIFSLFGRIDYSFDHKYLASVTVRRDGSSRFGPDSRYGVFPSYSAAWRISEEGFMKDISWLNDLKIRASYGILGSQNNVGRSNAFTLYGIQAGEISSYYDIAGSGTSLVQGFRPASIGNSSTGWEQNIVTNVGFDLTVLNSLSISAEYYKKSISGLLFTEPLPSVIGAGVTAPTVNIGDVQNVGIDLSVEYRGKVNELNYSLRTDFTHYKNKIVSLPSPGYNDSNPVRNQIGHPMYSFFGYKIIGLFNSDDEVSAAPTQDGAAPGRFRFQDSNNDGKISPDDRVHFGSPHPDFTAGLNLSAQYKNFDLSAFFYASVGNEVMNWTKLYTHFMSFYPNTNKSNDLLNAWTPQNTNTKIPIVETSQNFSNSANYNTTFFLEDASYLKLKNLQLGYTFNKNITEKVNVSNLRLFVQMANLFTLTKYSGLDPEIYGLTIDYGSFPNNEFSIIFGVALNF